MELMPVKNAQHACATDSNDSFHFARTGMRGDEGLLQQLQEQLLRLLHLSQFFFRIRFRGLKPPVFRRRLLTILVKLGRVG